MKLLPSAVAIVLARDGANCRVALVGTRHVRSRFLGGFVAFPGGGHEMKDGDLGTDSVAALRRTASRELFEEAGVDVPPEAFLDAGRRVTPPFTPRGFDSRMFVVELPGIRDVRASDPAELINLMWARPEELLRRWRELEIRVAPPLLPIVRELAGANDAPLEEVARRLRQVNEEMEADGPRIEFVPDILMIPVRTATLPPATHTNSYLIGCKELVIVDPGSSAADEIARLERHVRRRIAEGTRPRAILLTHHHADHVGGAESLARALRIPILAHAHTFARLSSEGAKREELADGEALTLAGGERLVALHTPGHAPGHLAILEESHGSLFVGDLLSGVSTILVDGEPGSLDLYLDSLRRLLELPARTLFPAHGPPMIDPPSAIRTLLDHRRQREERIVAAMREGASTLDEIAQRAYSDTPGADPALAEHQSRAHLDRLERLGAARRTGERWTLLES